MTNTDEAYRRYCETHGPCNRVVFDAAFQMGRESMVAQLRTLESDWLYAADKTESDWYTMAPEYRRCAEDLRTVLE